MVTGYRNNKDWAYILTIPFCSSDNKDELGHFNLHSYLVIESLAMNITGSILSYIKKKQFENNFLLLAFMFYTEKFAIIEVWFFFPATLVTLRPKIY